MARYDRTIPPGREGKISLQVQTKGYHGNFHKTAQVTTNDPKNPKLTIGVKGKVWSPIHISPRNVHLKGTLGEMTEKIVQLRGEKKDALIVKLASVDIPDKVEVELKEMEKGRSYQLKVKNKVQKAAAYAGQVKLTTNYPEEPEIIIRILGGIRAPVEVRPRSLNWGPISEERLEQLKKTGRSMKRPVVVLLNKGNGLKIDRVEVEESLFKVVTKEMRQDRVVELLVEPIFEKLKKGPNADGLKIYMNQGEYQVEVPIQFEVR